MKRFAVLGSRTSLKSYHTREGFCGGVHLGTPAADLPFAVAELSGEVDALYVEEKAHFLIHVRAGLGVASALPLVLFTLDAQGVPRGERAATVRDLPAPPDSLEACVAREVERRMRGLLRTVEANSERTMLRILRSVEFQKTVGSAVMQGQRDILEDIAYLLNLRAGLDSADFVREHIPLHLLKSGAEALRRDAVLAAPADGLFLEFGVWKGRWLRFLAGERAVRFFGFDSFEGLPESWSLRPAGTFDLDGQMPEMPANVTLVKGWFENSLKPFLAEHPGEPVAYIDMDCDIYSATSYVLETLKERLRVGTVILLDDFMIKPGWEKAEHKAFMDFVRKYGVTFEYTGYYSMSASVRLTGLGRLGPPHTRRRAVRAQLRRRKK